MGWRWRWCWRRCWRREHGRRQGRLGIDLGRVLGCQPCEDKTSFRWHATAVRTSCWRVDVVGGRTGGGDGCAGDGECSSATPSPVSDNTNVRSEKGGTGVTTLLLCDDGVAVVDRSRRCDVLPTPPPPATAASEMNTPWHRRTCQYSSHRVAHQCTDLLVGVLVLVINDRCAPCRRSRLGSRAHGRRSPQTRGPHWALSQCRLRRVQRQGPGTNSGRKEGRCVSAATTYSGVRVGKADGHALRCVTEVLKPQHDIIAAGVAHLLVVFHSHTPQQSTRA